MLFRYWLIISLFSLSSCSNLLFVPVKPYPLTPADADIVYEDITVVASDGVRLHGWRLHAGKSRAGNIIFFHGNGDNISTQLPNTFWLAKEGYDVYVFDYRGYGQSQGEVDLDATIVDMELMVGRVTEIMPTDEKLIVMGHSLGGSMAIYVTAHSAFRDRIAALITVEAFSDYHEVTREVLAKSWLLWMFQWPLSFTIDNTYRPLDSIGLISPIPVAIIHSKTDEIINIHHAGELFAAASAPKEIILIESNHGNIFVTKQNRQILLNYLTTVKNKW